ncbi:hypothetical membrane associated protein [Streptococcus pyogenes]|uniref:hypothetical protein n=1 Tax=Streptococcus pyogenes TaxID=1314 RepID=UPI00109D2F10|nr:hypothetical protein [Streptococcus pyogenes]VGT77728.1 hypothetical membrane associated protein [Streptococcus pyogenes]
MKTRSKRFLKLATLCLALLGTNLLTTQPAEAEVILLPINGNGSGSSKSQAKSQAAEDDLKVDWYKGYRDGLKKGEEASEYEDLVREEIPVPQGVSDKTEYWDGYETGYSEGWHKKHGFGESSDSDTDSNQNKHSQEGQEADDSSQDDGGHQDSVDSSSQQEDTDIISPIVETVLQAVLDVLSSFLSWLAS